MQGRQGGEELLPSITGRPTFCSCYMVGSADTVTEVKEWLRRRACRGGGDGGGGSYRGLREGRRFALVTRRQGLLRPAVELGQRYAPRVGNTLQLRGEEQRASSRSSRLGFDVATSSSFSSAVSSFQCLHRHRPPAPPTYTNIDAFLLRFRVNNSRRSLLRRHRRRPLRPTQRYPHARLLSPPTRQETALYRPIGRCSRT